MARRSNVKFIIDIFASKISLLILGSLTMWLGYSAAKEAYRKHQVQAEIDALKIEILELERKNSSLSSLIESFKDPQNIELEAKRRLNLKKPGDEVAVILRDKDNEGQNIAQGDSYDTVQDDSQGSLKDVLNPVKWWQYITNSRD